MAEKKVIWSVRAQNDRYKLLDYWINRNKSTSYSIKLNKAFIEAERLIAAHPEIGKPTDIEDIRIKLIRNCLMIYKISDDDIQILTLKDARQHPNEVEKVIQKRK